MSSQTRTVALLFLLLCCSAMLPRHATSSAVVVQGGLACVCCQATGNKDCCRVCEVGTRVSKRMFPQEKPHTEEKFKRERRMGCYCCKKFQNDYCCRQCFI